MPFQSLQERMPGAQGRGWDGVTFSFGAEAGNRIEATLQLTERGHNVSGHRWVTFWLSNQAAGVPLATASPSGGTINTNAQDGDFLVEPEDNRFIQAVTNDSGSLQFNVEEATNKRFYISVQAPDGRVIVSGDMGFA